MVRDSRKEELLEEIQSGVETQGRLSPESGKRSTAELTDLNGVGPSTANKLRQAEITSPVELQGVPTEAIAAINGIGLKKAEQIKTQVEYGRPDDDSRALVTPGEDHDVTGEVHRNSRRVELDATGETDKESLGREISFMAKGNVPTQPGSVGVTGEDKDEALEHMADRSPDERQTDRLFNAPITLDVEYWQQHDSEVDYPGVDTVPRGRKRERAFDRLERGVDEGLIRDFKTVDSGTSSYVSGIKRLSLGSDDDPEGTFSHEFGHAVDTAISEVGQEEKQSHTMFQDEQSKKQAERLSERRRNEGIEDTRRTYETDPFATDDDEDDDSFFGELSGAKDYPFEEELFADVYASMAVEPRAARREAPDAVKEVEDELLGTGFLPNSPL